MWSNFAASSCSKERSIRGGFDAAQELLAVAPYYWSLDDTTREDGSAADMRPSARLQRDGEDARIAGQ